MEYRSTLKTTTVYIAAVLLGLVLVTPFAWLFIMSISSPADLSAMPLHWLPQSFDFSRYVTLLTVAQNSAGAAFLASLRNSLEGRYVPIAT